jgi:peroxiredoxin
LKTTVLVALLCILLPFAAEAEYAERKAPSFRLPDTTGAAIAIEDFKGKVLLLNFWATWCRSCREELTELDRLYHKFQGRGFVVIGISVDGSSERVAAFMKKRPVGFPVVIDTQGDVADAYRFSGIPAAFLISRDGVIMHSYRGSGKELISKYETDIEALLKRR